MSRHSGISRTRAFFTLRSSVRFVFALFLFGLLESAAEAQTSRDQAICNDMKADDLARIKSCSALIEAPRLPNGQAMSPKSRAEFYLRRGFAYEKEMNFDQAIADHEVALPHYPNTQHTMVRRMMLKRLLAYLHEIQTDGDDENWQKPPFDAVWKWTAVQPNVYQPKDTPSCDSQNVDIATVTFKQ